MPTQSDGRTVADSLLAAVQLALIPGIGPRTQVKLRERFGSPASILAAAPADVRQVQGLGPKLCRAIADARDCSAARTELELCAASGVNVLIDTDDLYPRPLSDLPDPPGVLFCRGAWQASDALAIAIVGSRHATRYGLEQAERLAGSLARAGITIISGLARGIDAAAHRGALDAGGRTIAVLASGVLNIYPPEHVGLADEIAAHGAVISESPPQAAPLSGMFPQRNRIISGLSLGVLVVEAANRSGALITARHAMEQGRDVFAVPGPVTSRMSRGCHRLIRDGAKLVETADDVLEELGPLVEAAPTVLDGREIHHPAELALNDVERTVLDAIGSEATPVDTIISTSGLPTPQVLAALSVLEMRHLIRRLSGNLVQRL
jgi:DNA processing protein